MSVIVYTASKFRCALCGKRVSAADSSYSRVSHSHYCIDHEACKARGRKRA